MSTRTLVLLLAACFCGVLDCDAQTTGSRRAEVARRLTGGAEKEWVFERWVFHMGGERCEQGESYVFNADGMVLKKQCVRQRVVSSRQRWRLEFPSRIDVVVVIDNDRYNLILQPAPAPDARVRTERMTLRTPSPSTVDRTIDREYVHTPRRRRSQ